MSGFKTHITNVLLGQAKVEHGTVALAIEFEITDQDEGMLTEFLATCADGTGRTAFIYLDPPVPEAPDAKE
jgi:hypothetical protein